MTTAAEFKRSAKALWHASRAFASDAEEYGGIIAVEICTVGAHIHINREKPCHQVMDALPCVCMFMEDVTTLCAAAVVMTHAAFAYSKCSKYALSIMSNVCVLASKCAHTLDELDMRIVQGIAGVIISSIDIETNAVPEHLLAELDRGNFAGNFLAAAAGADCELVREVLAVLKDRNVPERPRPLDADCVRVRMVAMALTALPYDVAKDECIVEAIRALPEKDTACFEMFTHAPFVKALVCAILHGTPLVQVNATCALEWGIYERFGDDKRASKARFALLKANSEVQKDPLKGASRELVMNVASKLIALLGEEARPPPHLYSEAPKRAPAVVATDIIRDKPRPSTPPAAARSPSPTPSPTPRLKKQNSPKWAPPKRERTPPAAPPPSKRERSAVAAPPKAVATTSARRTVPQPAAKQVSAPSNASAAKKPAVKQVVEPSDATATGGNKTAVKQNAAPSASAKATAAAEKPPVVKQISVSQPRRHPVLDVLPDDLY